MKEKIIEIIKKNNGKVTLKNLLSVINIGRYELEDLLLEMKLTGQILQEGNKYRIFPEDRYIGDVACSETGHKYIICNGEKVVISSNFLGDLILNDVVTFKVNDNGEAYDISIVHRFLNRMTCEIKEIAGKKTLIPFHQNINFKFDNNLLSKFTDGDIIVIELPHSSDGEIPYAEFIKKLGRRDDPLIDDVAIALNYGFGDDYDEEFLKEMERIPTYVRDQDIVNRVDFRDQLSCTMDGINTKDMDDGLYAEKLDNDIIRVYVHIAHVSSYIKPYSRIFERACDKTTSLYLNNTVFHMLHYIISSGICSLNEAADRLTRTFILDIDKNGDIVNFNFVNSVTNSKKKMTYEDVDQILMYDNMVPGYEKFEKLIYILYEAALRLEQRFVDVNGKLNFANTESSIKYNDDGTIKSVANHENSVSRKIVENLMLATGESLGNWFFNQDFLAVYRDHDFPNLKKVNAVIEKLNKSGYHIKPVSDCEDTKAIQKILQIVSKYEEFPIISQMLVMAMQRAGYSIHNRGHYALGFIAYIQATSPIRRLADLIIHTLLDKYVKDPQSITREVLKEYEEALETLCIHASRMERQAKMAELVAERRQILKMLNKNKNAIYQASVVDIGNKVKLRLEGVETYVDVHSLKDILGYDSKRKRFYDKETGQHLKIGTKLEIKIKSVDPIRDSFNVIVLGMVNNKVKTRTLEQ